MNSAAGRTEESQLFPYWGEYQTEEHLENSLGEKRPGLGIHSCWLRYHFFFNFNNNHGCINHSLLWFECLYPLKLILKLNL